VILCDWTDGSNAVLVQLLLSIDRKDLAQTTYQNVKKFGNDSILVQAMEAWIGLKTVSLILFPLFFLFVPLAPQVPHASSEEQANNKGSRPLHQSYYFYEELYQLPSGRTSAILASHAAAHLLLGHVDEAKADIEEAIQQGGEADGDVLAVGASLGMEGYAQYVPSDFQAPHQKESDYTGNYQQMPQVTHTPKTSRLNQPYSTRQPLNSVSPPKMLPGPDILFGRTRIGKRVWNEIR